MKFIISAIFCQFFFLPVAFPIRMFHSVHIYNSGIEISHVAIIIRAWFLEIFAGHFLPEEDDKFLERVQAAAEEEERQALAAADTDAAKDAIATAEESRKMIQNQGNLSKGPSNDDNEPEESKKQKTGCEDEAALSAVDEKESHKEVSDGQSSRGAYDYLANLPIEFYHYYHGSNNDMGTLIEVILVTSFVIKLYFMQCSAFLLSLFIRCL